MSPTCRCRPRRAPTGRSRSRRDRAPGPTPRECNRAAPRGGAPRSRAASARRGCARSAPRAAPATRRARSSSPPCGTAGTCRRCRRRRASSSRPRRCAASSRCDRTTPLGRPVLPLVKKMTCGSLLSSRPAVALRLVEAFPARSPEMNGTGSAIRELERGLPVRGAREEQARPGVLAHRRHLLERGTGVERREHRAELRQRGEHGNRVEVGVAPPQHAVAAPTPSAASALAIWFARDSISPNVSDWSASVAATAPGATRAAFSRMELTSSIAAEPRAARPRRASPVWLSTMIVDRVRLS